MYVGVDPYKFIEEKDELKRVLLVEAADEVLKKMEIRDHNLATEIANKLSKIFEG